MKRLVKPYNLKIEPLLVGGQNILVESDKKKINKRVSMKEFLAVFSQASKENLLVRGSVNFN